MALAIVLTMGLLWSSVHAFQSTDRIICGTDEGNGIWCTSYTGMEHGSWARLPGILKQVVVRDGHMWGINTQYEIYYAADINNPKWTRIHGKAKEITEGHGVLCTVNDTDQVWCADQGITTPDPQWHQAPNHARLGFISVN